MWDSCAIDGIERPLLEIGGSSVDDQGASQ